MLWLRRNFIAGFFVVVPLFISVAAFIWVFGVVDGLTTPLYDRVIGRRIPGLGTLTTAAAIVLVGAFARNVIGRRVLQRGESWLLRVPGLPDDLCAGQTVDRGFLAGQRVGVQAGGDGSRTRSAGSCSVPDARVHDRPRERTRSAARGLRARRIISIWATS
jgi:hypothetical protein